MQLTDKKKIVFLIGPTAVGKTAFSIKLAKAIDGEIISADSRYLYRGMNIGTAKPALKEQGNIPHHLIDIVNPDENWSFSDYLIRAKRLIEDIHSRKKIPLLVGGTGQYFRGIVEGWAPPEFEPDKLMRKVLEKWAEDIGRVGLYQRLQIIDPEAADKIDPNNLRRTVRALEVIITTGKLFSAQRVRHPIPYKCHIIGLIRERKDLYQRIDKRIEMMFENGLLDEVDELVKSGYSPDLPSFSAIGYKEAAAVNSGKMTKDEAIILMKRNTRKFVRRQANWFKKDDPRINWYDAETISVDLVMKEMGKEDNWVC